MEQQKPLISVVVPVYNVAPYLERCLVSIQTQTWPNLEIILVDDASRDGSAEICDAFARRDGRVIVVHLPKNRGPSAARNAGVCRAEGQFLSFVDADDHIEPDLLERLYDNLVEEKADVSICGADGIRIVGGPAGVFSGRQARLALARGVPFNHVPWGKLYDMEMVRNCPFDEAVFYSEDLLFLYQLFEKTGRVSYLPEKLYHYGDREGSQVHSGVSRRKMTALAVHDRICRDAAISCPEALDEFRQLVLDTNLRLAIQAVKVNRKEASGYVKRLRENTRRHFSRRALAGFPRKKDALGVLALSVSAPLFQGLLALWYHGVKPLVRPAAGETVFERGAEEKVIEERTVGERSVTEKSVPERSAAERSVAERLTFGRPTSEKAAAGRRAELAKEREDG